MYTFEQQIRVRLQFDAMEGPVEISVPWHVLRYLDTHSDRWIASDGTVVYEHPRRPRVTAKRFVQPRRMALCAA